jgi:competence protein ComEC
MLRARPLASLAAGFVAGIAAARGLEGRWLPFLIAALAGAALMLRWRHPLLVASLGLGLGGLRQEWARTREPLPLGDGIEGVVAGPPRVSRPREGSLEDPDPAPPMSGSFVVGRVQVRYFGMEFPLIGGERVSVRGPMRRPRHATNPGQFDYGAYLERQGIEAVLTLGRPEDLEVLEGPGLLARMRARLRGLYDRRMRPEVGAFLSALVLGRREAVPEDLVANLQRSGTAHLLAISGQNLVIVLVSLWSILVVVGIGGRAQSFLLLYLLGLYVLLTGLQVSVVRSYLMMAAFFGADLFWRKRDAVSALGLAAILLCAFDPDQVADVGFQLSFAAVLGLSLVSPVFHAFAGSGGWAWNRLRSALAVSLSAWLATAPIVLANFNLLTPGIVLANLVLVPLISAEFVVGLAHLVLAPLGAGVLSGGLAGLLFDFIRGAAEILNAVPLAYVYAPPAGPALVALYYAGLAAWTAWCRLTRERWWKPAALLVIVAPLGMTGLRHRPPEGLHLAVLDVGRGSCAYLEWPDGRNLMVDCGSLDLRDPGASVAARYLWWRGVTRLDTLVLSHPDADHVNGARSVIDLLKVRRLVLTRAFDGRRWPGDAEVVVVERRGEPGRLGEIEILGPPVWEKFGRETPPNETSIVLRAGGVLLPGDVQDRGVEELLELRDLGARVLVMPHHGKFFKRHEEFVRRVSPETVIVSAPRGYSSERVLSAIRPPPRLTGDEGAILLDLPAP